MLSFPFYPRKAPAVVGDVLACGQAPHIHALGSLRVVLGDRVFGTRDLGGVKPKQILEVLLLARGRPVSKDRIAEMLWGENPPRNISATLETYVSVLRGKLGGGGRKHAVIVTDHEAYRLNCDVAQVDLDTFDDLIDQARDAVDQDTRTELLQEAVAMIRGELLEDEPYADWVEPCRTTYRGRCVEVLLELATTALESGAGGEAIARAEMALAIDPLDERVLRVCMLAYHGAGRTHEAVRAYRRSEELWRREFDLHFDPATQRLLELIRARAEMGELLPSLATVGHAAA
jgi:DNA-binding SARP family transcriptional activator